MNGKCTRLDPILPVNPENSLNTTLIYSLLNFNTAVYLPHKQPTGEKSNGARQNKEQETYESAITQIEHIASKASKTKFRDPINDSVEEDVNSTCPGSEEGSPLPMVIF